MGNKNSNKGVITLLIVIIVILAVLCVLFATGTINLKTTTTSNTEQTSENKNPEESNVISDQEALNIGKELYDKTTTAYETWQLVPYCGVAYSEAVNKSISIGQGKYYDSGFSNLDELKQNLSKWLSNDIINSKINEEAITDLSILNTPGKEYTNYVIKDGKLYCRTNTGKGWLSRYLGNYDIKVNTIKDDIIIYDVKLANINEYTATQTDSKCTYGSKITDCSENQIEYVDTKFIIKKINKNWIVTDYVLHD